MPNKICATNIDEITTIKDWALLDCRKEMVIASISDIQVGHANQDSVSIEIYTVSRGKTEKDATKKALQMMFTPQITDSSVIVPQYIPITDSEVWRQQRVFITIKVPHNIQYKLLKNGIIEETSIIK